MSFHGPSKGGDGKFPSMDNPCEELVIGPALPAFAGMRAEQVIQAASGLPIRLAASRNGELDPHPYTQQRASLERLAGQARGQLHRHSQLPAWRERSVKDTLP